MSRSAHTRRTFLESACTATVAGRLQAALSEPADEDLRLWYRQPAPDWNEALPIGNGRLGAMIFGGVPKELLQLNEDTLCSDEPGRRDLNLDVTKEFNRVTGLLRSGRYVEAADIITKQWGGRSWYCYQPLGDLHLEFEDKSPFSEYARDLDLRRAVGSVYYKQNGIAFTREYFATHPDRIIVARLTANKPGSLTLRASLSSVHPTAKMSTGKAGELVLKGQAPGFALRRTLDWVEKRGEQWKYPELWDKDGKRRPNAKTVLYGDEINGLGTFFEARLRAVVKGGEVESGADGLHVRGASEVVLLLSAATSYNGFDKSPSRQGVDPSIRAKADLDAAEKKPFDALHSAHVADYKKLFDRVSINLGQLATQNRLPTDERIVQFTNDKDPSLAALYFQYGRYLMIAGSRPGTQPLNLQGIWNKDVIPPWACGYTTNINVEMNYWPAEITNLPECAEPLFRMLRELSVTGGQVAKKMYKRRGWVLHHNTTLWRDAQPVDNDARPAFWPVGAGWMCEHLWEHYLFTGDSKFLAGEAYPLMKGAAEFLSDWLVDDGQGRLVTAAGNSPENTFSYKDRDGKERLAGVTMGPTMDLAIVRELFANCIQAAGILGLDAGFREELKTKLLRLLPYQVGKRGQLLEWPADFEERDPLHRHVSHLYALHPSNQISPRTTPKLSDAAKRTLEFRGDEGTGWSRAWKINFWARLEDGNHAYKILRNLFEPAKSAPGRYNRGGVLPNLFCSCPPMQIDGNFGGAAGIAEMLLQSHLGEVHLLPARPDAWPSGRVTGLCARDGFDVSIVWEAGKLVSASIRSKLGRTCEVRYAGRTASFKTEAGKTYSLNAKLEAKAG